MTGAPIDASLRNTSVSVEIRGNTVRDSYSNLDVTPQVIMTPGSERPAFNFDDNLGIDPTFDNSYSGYTGAGGGTQAIGAATDSQLPIQFKDEGSNLGGAGHIQSINFVGSGVVATVADSEVTVTVSSGGGGGSMQVKDEGVDQGSGSTSINFVGAGVVATDSGGAATITIPRGDTDYICAFIQKPTNGVYNLAFDLPVAQQIINTNYSFGIGTGVAVFSSGTVAIGGNIIMTLSGLSGTAANLSVRVTVKYV